MRTDKVNLDLIESAAEDPIAKEEMVDQFAHVPLVNAVESDEFLPMNNKFSSTNKRKTAKLINSNKKKDIFAFGNESPDLEERYGHLLGMRKLANLKLELNSNNSYYFFPANNPFLLQYSEYEQLDCKLNYADKNRTAISILRNINIDFLNEMTNIVSIAFEIDEDKASDDDLKRRDNSIKVVLMLALVNTCNKFDVKKYFAAEATKNVSFMIVFNAICEIIDLLRNQVTYAEN